MKMIKYGQCFTSGLSILVLASFASLSLAATESSSAKDCMQHKGSEYHQRHGEGRPDMAKLADTLDLTEDQKQTLAAYKKEQGTNHRAQRKAMHEAQKDLNKAAENNASAAELEQLAEQVGNLSAKQALARVQNKQFMLSILTPEQQAKFEQLKTERKKHWQEKRTKDKV